MNTIGPGPAPQLNPRIHVTGQVDATECTVEPFLAHRVDDFKEISAKADSHIDGMLQVYRGGTTASHKVWRGLAELGAHLAIPAAGFMVGGPIGLGVGLLVDAGMFVAGITRAGLGHLMSGVVHNSTIPEGGDWKGGQSVTLGANAQSSAQDASAKMSPQGLTQLLSDNVQKDATNVVYLSGHGLGIHQAAGMTTPEVANALKISHETTGIKPDFLILESCLQSNLEALASYQGNAHIAIVSEEALSASENAHGLPLQKMLGEISQGGTAAEAAVRMIGDAKANEIMTLAAVDLDKFGEVTKSLEPLGGALLADVKGGKKAAIQQAIKDAVKFPNMAMMPLEKAMMHISDLGGFLDNLQAADISPESKAAAARTRELLNDSMLAHTEGKGYEKASGVSFQTGTGVLDKRPGAMGAFQDAPLPDAWGQFLEGLNAKDSK